jgi:hypothetical protein
MIVVTAGLSTPSAFLFWVFVQREATQAMRGIMLDEAHIAEALKIGK